MLGWIQTLFFSEREKKMSLARLQDHQC